MKKIVIGLVVAIGVVSIAACDVAVGNVCDPGWVSCGSGCMPSGDSCCSDSTYCDPGYACGPGDTCLTPQEVACENCLASGEQCCANYDGTVDCAPAYGECCGNHTYCASGYCCTGGCC